MSPEKCRHFERLIDTYTDNIRASDVKSNIIGIMIIFSVSVLAIFRLEFPSWLPFYIILLLPMGSLFFIILSIYPRFSAFPGFPFYVKASISPTDFSAMPEDDNDLLDAYRKDCASLAKILYRKIMYFKIALGFCFLYFAILFVLAVAGVRNAAPTTTGFGDPPSRASVAAPSVASN